jgi:thymidylate kinase
MIELVKEEINKNKPFNHKALMIDFEGPDYCYKSTICNNVVEQLKEIYPYMSIQLLKSITYDTEESIFIRNYLNGYYGNPYDIKGIIPSHFYAMNRYDTIKRNKNIFDDPNAIIITDRWTLSNIIYQAETDYDYEKICDMEHNTFNIPSPDLTFIIQQDYETALDLMMDDPFADLLEGSEENLKEIYTYFYSKKTKYITKYVSEYSGRLGKSLEFINAKLCFNKDRNTSAYFKNEVIALISDKVEKNNDYNGGR